jgi:hypothetical protein
MTSEPRLVTAGSPAVDAPHASLMREAKVVRIDGDGAVVVTVDAEAEIVCEQLATTGIAALTIAPRDRVLVWQSDHASQNGVVLGRIGPSHADDSPEELVLEATQSLVLRVGDGSITIRADGKILIKGKDLVSHATRVNRVKGGAVAIN